MPGKNTTAYWEHWKIMSMKCFITLAPRGINYKTLSICNVWRMYIIYSRLVLLLLLVTFTGLDKHTSLPQNLHYSHQVSQLNEKIMADTKPSCQTSQKPVGQTLLANILSHLSRGPLLKGKAQYS
jgi:hypothetical protein